MTRTGVATLKAAGHSVLRALREVLGRWQTMRTIRRDERRHSVEFETFFKEQMLLAEQAAYRGDRKQALKIWHEMRGTFREQATTFPSVMRLLLKLGEFDELDAIMDEGRRRYPYFEHFAIGYVQVAQQRGDLEEAVRRCKIIRRKLPRLADGYTVAADCLAKLGRLDEADAIFERAIHKVPPGLNLLSAYAAHAERHKDWPEALRRWEVARSRFNHIKSYYGVMGCLRRMGQLDEAETVARETCDRFPSEPWAYAMLADIAADRGDPVEAAQRWDLARRRCPFFAHAFKAGVAAERRIGREDKADAILAEGVTRIRGDLDLHLDYARSAQRRGEWATAAERWALVRERFPAEVEPYIELACCMHELRQLDELETLATEAKERFPNDANIAVQYAFIAHDRGELQTARSRWEWVRDNFPACKEGYIGSARTLAALGKAEEADALLQEARRL